MRLRCPSLRSWPALSRVSRIEISVLPEPQQRMWHITSAVDCHQSMAVLPTSVCQVHSATVRSRDGDRKLARGQMRMRTCVQERHNLETTPSTT